MDNEIAIQLEIKATDYLDAENKFRKQLIESGITPLPTIQARATVPMRDKGIASVRAYFSHPLEILALSEIKSPQKSQEQIITPDMAGALYKAVVALGKGSELNGLTNTQKPEKFAKALEILGVQADKIGFNGTQGYKVHMNSDNFDKVQNISNPSRPESLTIKHQ